MRPPRHVTGEYSFLRMISLVPQFIHFFSIYQMVIPRKTLDGQTKPSEIGGLSLIPSHKPQHIISLPFFPKAVNDFTISPLTSKSVGSLVFSQSSLVQLFDRYRCSPFNEDWGLCNSNPFMPRTCDDASLWHGQHSGDMIIK